MAFPNIFDDLAKMLKIEKLDVRRVNIDVQFVNKLVNGNINCPKLLDRIQFCAPPRNLRIRKTFYLQQHYTLYGVNSPIDRMMSAANSFTGDLFNIAVLPLKRMGNGYPVEK